jgi:lysophospholipid acyltransferase (LPLAT)-like uncharacterized protein
VIPFLGALLIRTLHATLRVRHVRRETIDSARQYILAFWHAHILLMLHSAWRRPISVLVSQSRDGEYIAGIIARYGAETSRGSSTRGGGAALRDMIRLARRGKNLAFTPDGPKGPARVAKEGVVLAAQATGLPIIPVAFAAKKKSWSARGTGPCCRIRSRARSSSTASRWPSRAMATSRNGAGAWRTP